VSFTSAPPPGCCTLGFQQGNYPRNLLGVPRDTPLELCGTGWKRGNRIAILVFMSDVTQILGKIESGDQQAAEELLPLVYDELRKLAADKMARENPGQTLQATALISSH